MADTVFTDARVLDVVAGEYQTGQSVRIADGKIVEIGSSVKANKDSIEIPLNGKTLMPGLCDAHVHVTAYTADFAKLKATSPFYVGIKAFEIMGGMLARGFTTVRDAGGADHGLANAVEENPTAAPRLLFCGHALSQTGGHGDMRRPGEVSLHQCFCCSGMGHVCDGITEVLRAAREEIRRGATHLKIMASGGVSSPTDRITSTQFTEEELRAIVNEANAANIPVMAHAYTSRAINRALKCGVKSIEHGNLLDQGSVDLMLDDDRFLVPTLVIYHALVQEGTEAGLSADMVQKTWEVLDAGLDALKLAYQQNVNIAFGTDLLGIMHRRQLEEFTLRSPVVSNDDLVRQATCNAARLFNMEDQIGQVKEGLLADLIVIDGDPLEDIRALTTPETSLKMVMKEGQVCINNLT
ncbi:MAG: amidohydrolase family protein [Candidatus Puniceispirillales bacterium]